MALVGERKAVASAILALYTLLFLLSALSIPDQRMVPFLLSLAATYGLAFFSVVAGYFWARWFAIGLGLYGASTGFLLVWQIGPEPVVLFYALTHGAISMLLWGPRVPLPSSTAAPTGASASIWTKTPPIDWVAP